MQRKFRACQLLSFLKFFGRTVFQGAYDLMRLLQTGYLPSISHFLLWGKNAPGIFARSISTLEMNELIIFFPIKILLSKQAILNCDRFDL